MLWNFCAEPMHPKPEALGPPGSEQLHHLGMREKGLIVRCGFNQHGGPRHPLEVGPVLDHPLRQGAVRKGTQNGRRKRWKALRGVATEGKERGRIHGVLQGMRTQAPGQAG
jgi:hypothetical protein